MEHKRGLPHLARAYEKRDFRRLKMGLQFLEEFTSNHSYENNPSNLKVNI